MIASQRKAHKWIWVLIGITVPIALFFILTNLNFSRMEIDQTEDQLIVQKVDNRVEIVLHRPFVSPSTVVYGLSPSGKSEVLGQIQGVGTYSFKVKKETNGLLIRDELKKKELFKVEF